MADSRTPEEFFASIQRAQQTVADNAALAMSVLGTSPEQMASARVAWLTKVYDEDPQAGPAPDRVAAAALALAERYGRWYDPVLSPETAVEIVETVMNALDGRYTIRTEQ